VGNAQRIRNVPGKKSDVKDAEWLAQLLRHGLIAKSFVPPRPIRELRELLRYRRQLIESRSSERNRLLKLLESANIKLASVATDVFGVSGMAMLRALAKGDHDPAELAQLARGTLRKKLEPLCLALEGRMEHSHRLMLEIQLARLDESDAHLARLWQWVSERLKPYHTQMVQLMQVYGIDQVVAAGLIAEFGVDMGVFKDVSHMAAWVGVCPGINESAGKRLSGRTCKGNPYARSLLVQAAAGAIRKKGSYLRDKFFRLKSRRGYKRALFAIAHKILIAVYHVLSRGVPYRDLGEGYLDQLARSRIKSHLLARLQRLGYKVTLEPLAA
jgi:transposase